jgi:hypothetical protein
LIERLQDAREDDDKNHIDRERPPRRFLLEIVQRLARFRPLHLRDALRPLHQLFRFVAFQFPVRARERGEPLERSVE